MSQNEIYKNGKMFLFKAKGTHYKTIYCTEQCFEHCSIQCSVQLSHG